jgi:hypothetical protein
MHIHKEKHTSSVRRGICSPTLSLSTCFFNHEFMTPELYAENMLPTTRKK